MSDASSQGDKRSSAALSKVSVRKDGGKTSLFNAKRRHLQTKNSGRQAPLSQILSNTRKSQQTHRAVHDPVKSKGSRDSVSTTPSPPPLVKREVELNDTRSESSKKPSLVECEMLGDAEESSSGESGSLDEDEDDDDDDGYEFWQPPQGLNKTLDTVTITDVTADSVTITFRECNQREGFFKLGST
jgi:hypothetical protein